jgi:hypothetical protein
VERICQDPAIERFAGVARLDPRIGEKAKSTTSLLEVEINYYLS